MATLHRVSSCCRTSIRRFGERRRQCIACKRTWRIHQHRRGRKWRRPSVQFVHRILGKGYPIAEAQDRHRTLSPRGLRKRFHRALAVSLKRSRRMPCLRGIYLLIADGVWYTFGGEEWVLYLLLLKPRKRNYAYLLDPVMLKGRERFQNWKRVIQSIPESTRRRITAFVSDHFSASERIVRYFKWIHQLCHFHLIAELQKRRGRRKIRLAGASIREEIYQCVVNLLAGNNTKIEQKLRQLIRNRECPRKVAMIAREFLRARNRYWSYLRYPELTIPKTTGAAESLGKLIRKRTWPLRNPTAVLQWATAFVRLRKKMNCNNTHAVKKKSTKLSS